MIEKCDCLINADCMESIKTINSETVDCVITDCPYHIVSGGCTNDAVKIGRYREMSGFISHRIDNARSDAEENAIRNTRQGKIFEYNDIEFSEWLPEIYRVLKNNTHCYIMVNPRNLKELWECAEKVGFEFQQLLVWDKGNATPNKWYMNAYELILMLRKGGAKNINNMGTYNILRVPNVMRTKYHPTEKSVDLMRILVENSTKEGDVVLDPFMGSGSTGVACKELGRRFIGIEIDTKYYDIAKKRMSGTIERDQIEGQTNIFELLGEE